MAPLPVSNTPRLEVDYDACQHVHTVQVRWSAPNTVVDAAEALDELWSAYGGNLYRTTVVGARTIAAGSNISVPYTWPGSAEYGDTIGPAKNTAAFYDVVGRSADGRRVRIAFFGAKLISSDTDYRWGVGEISEFDTVLSLLPTFEGAPVTISGEQPFWNPYINGGINAYWRNKIR